MKTFKRYFAMFMMLVVLSVSMIIPSAYSFMYDWKIETQSIYFEHNYGIDVAVDEDIDEGIKKNVKLTNTGDSPIFVKAMVVFTPVDKETGKVLTDKTVNLENDVQIEWNTEAIQDGLWITVAGTAAQKTHETSGLTNSNFYPYVFFWSKAIDSAPETEPDLSTDNLINSVIVTAADYNVRVDIIADAIYEGEVENWFSTYGLKWETDAINRTIAKA